MRTTDTGQDLLYIVEAPRGYVGCPVATLGWMPSDRSFKSRWERQGWLFPHLSSGPGFCPQKASSRTAPRRGWSPLSSAAPRVSLFSVLQAPRGLAFVCAGVPPWKASSPAPPAHLHPAPEPQEARPEHDRTAPFC